MSLEPLVLVTRTQPGASETASNAGAWGLAAVVAPVLTVAPFKVERGAFQDAQGIVVSSPNAAKQLAQDPPSSHTPVICVGETTARTARAAGCKRVISAKGDGQALVVETMRRFSPFAGRLVFARGLRVAMDVAGKLRQAGFQVDEVFTYDAKPVDRLPSAAVTALRSGAVRAVMFHSAVGAHTFAQLTDAEGLSWVCRRMMAAAISDNAFEPAAALGFQSHLIAPIPEDRALLEALASTLIPH